MLKFLLSTVAAVLFLSGLQANGQEQVPPCIPLNETVSICTNIDGLDVAIVGATETSVMGIVEVQDDQGASYGLWVLWADDASLEKTAAEQTRNFAKDYDQYEFQKPVSVVVEEFPGLRYDMLAGSKGDQVLPPKSLLFLDTGGGIAILFGEAQQPGQSADDLFLGARSAARVLNTAK